MSKNKLIFLLFFLLLCGSLLRGNHLSGRSLWTDEFFTLFLGSGHGREMKPFLDSFALRKPPPVIKAQAFKAFLKNDRQKGIRDVTEGMLYADTHPPFYFWLMYFWMRLFGDGAGAIRSFSLICGVLAIFMAYKAGKHLLDSRTACFCALYVAICAFAVRYSQEARAYSLIMLIGLTSLFLSLRFEKDRGILDGLLFMLINAIGIYTHYFYIFIAFAQFLYYTIMHRKNSALLTRFYIFFLGSIFLLLPWVLAVAQRGYNYYLAEWIFGYPGLINKASSFFLGLIGYITVLPVSNKTISALFNTAIILLFVWMAAPAIKDMFIRYRRQCLFCLILFFLPVTGMLFIDILQCGALLRQERFWVFSFIGFIPIMGYILRYIYDRKRMIFYSFISFMAISSLWAGRMQFGPAPAAVSEWINREASSANKSAVIIYNIRSAVFAQAYYLDDDIYLAPVADKQQLEEVFQELGSSTQKIFLVRHYHRTDNSLMTQPFMQAEYSGRGFCHKKDMKRDDIGISEYVKCVL
ncbi:MAG: glycosyltransferase family 39 protein [Candidatus Omnitrophota bacterium]